MYEISPIHYIYCLMSATWLALTERHHNEEEIHHLYRHVLLMINVILANFHFHSWEYKWKQICSLNCNQFRFVLIYVKVVLTGESSVCAELTSFHIETHFLFVPTAAHCSLQGLSKKRKRRLRGRQIREVSLFTGILNGEKNTI